MIALWEVLEAGFLTTVQDQGREGYERFGVPVSGAMDWFALAAANRLVGNDWRAAGIECAYLGAAFTAGAPCLVAAAGPGWSLRVGQMAFPAWTSVLAPAGSRIELVNEGEGPWGCLAVSGGLAVPPVLGSRSTYLRAGLGGFFGRALQPGDWLPLGVPTRADWTRFAGLSWPSAALPAYAKSPTLAVVRGAQVERFPAAVVAAFFRQPYRVSQSSDRMAYRLEGGPLDPGGRADILSEGLALGAVQVPGDGQPIVMLSDRQTAGGYRKLGAVIRTDIPLLAQCAPGTEVHFTETTVAQAHARYRALFAPVLEGLEPEEY